MVFTGQKTQPTVCWRGRKSLLSPIQSMLLITNAVFVL